MAGLGGLWWIDLIGNQQGPHDEHQLLYVEPGDGRLVLMHKLAREGVISEKFHYQIPQPVAPEQPYAKSRGISD